MVWIEPNEAGFRAMLNQQGVQRYLQSMGVRAQGVFRGTTRRSALAKPHNADSSTLKVTPRKGIRGDRPQASLTANMPYSLQREEGGTRNAFPEHSLKAAIGKAAATGGGGASGRARKLDRRYMSGSYLNRKSAAYDELDGRVSPEYMNVQRSRALEPIQQSRAAKAKSRRAYKGIDNERTRRGKAVLEWKW